MSDTKTKAEKAYPTEALLSSKALAGYQPDFARALLTKSAYTVREAKDILDKYLKGGKT
ncbi:MAG: hypothetical protein HFF70_03415 [Oscillospiraceae bacterium]|jgi:hypothetical protein|nr:hypothetical protein [Oscillospiraceae bacterium]